MGMSFQRKHAHFTTQRREGFPRKSKQRRLMVGSGNREQGVRTSFPRTIRSEVPEAFSWIGNAQGADSHAWDPDCTG